MVDANLVLFVFLHSLCVFRLSETESLINSHIHVPQCTTNELIFPGLCNCGEDNSCSRLRTGPSTPAVLFDTTYTFLCANITGRYVNLFVCFFVRLFIEKSVKYRLDTGANALNRLVSFIFLVVDKHLVGFKGYRMLLRYKESTDI